MPLVETVNATGSLVKHRELSGGLTLNGGSVSGNPVLQQGKITSELSYDGVISGKLRTGNASISGAMQSQLAVSGNMGFYPIVLTVESKRIVYDDRGATSDIVGI